MLNNKNLLFKRNIELGNGQYIGIACEMDSQGNPVQYSMACNLKDVKSVNDITISITGGYWLTKDTIRWYASEYSHPNYAFSAYRNLFFTPYLIAIQLEFSQEEASNITDLMIGLYGSDAQCKSFNEVLSAHNAELDVTATMNDDAFAGFTKYVNASIGSPSAFNNLWSI